MTSVSDYQQPKAENTYETLKAVRDALEFTDYIKEKHPKVYEDF